MERRFRETDSQGVREDLTKYMNTQHCPDCNGARLRKSARHVFIDEKPLPEVGNIPVGELADYF